MAILRKALADDADHPKYIETLTGRGYRLIAPVEWQPSQTAAQCLLEPRAETAPRIEGQISEREPRAARPWRKTAVLGGPALILVSAAYLPFRPLRDTIP